MQGIDIKGTIYDFFGYLIPGIVVILLMFLSYNHYFNNFNIFDSVEIFSDVSGTLIFIGLIISYCIGHAVSSASSFIIEKLIVEKNKDILSFEKIFTKDIKNQIDDKYREIFKSEYNDKSFRLLICYVQENKPSVYSTALVFLSIYGMARSITLSTGIFLYAELLNLIITNNCNLVIYIVIATIFVIIFFYEFIRFKKYHIEQIVYGFLIP